MKTKSPDPRRKRVQHPIQVMVPRDLEEDLTKEARETGLSRSELVRRACVEFVERRRIEREAEKRRKLLLSARGLMAHVPAGSDAFAERRAEETLQEDRNAVRP